MGRLEPWIVAIALSGLLGAASGCDDPSIGPIDGDASIRRDAGLGCAGDSDGDSILDAQEGAADPDGDGRPASDDDDSDGDGASDALEAGDADCATPPVDTDGDGVPDFLDDDGNGDLVHDATQHDRDTDADGLRDAIDLDVDGDTIRNRDERGPGPEARDSDGDGVPDVLDLDSDGDGLADRDEAGDLDPETPPAECAVDGDGAADAFDLDRDDDGLADGEEIAARTDPCDPDSDDDGADDLREVAYVRTRCVDPVAGGGECECARSSSCGLPDDVIVEPLPLGSALERTFSTGVTVRRADVFFAADTTASMGGTLANVRATIGEIVDRIAETIPDAWVGGGQIEDFPFSSYGGTGDRPFALAIGMTPAARASDVRAAFEAMALHGGGDGPEAHTEALHQIVTGTGGTWSWSGRSLAIPAHAGDCVAGTWGAPCFRDGSLPVVVLFTDTCSHGGPGDEDRTACTDYVGISPAPALWDETVALLRNRGATFVGINAAETIDCDAAAAPGGLSPCWFLRRTAIETSSVDVAGRPLVYDLPNASGSAAFADAIVAAIETVAMRVPRDVDAVLRADPASPLDASRFAPELAPACAAGATDCWIAPAGVPHEDAVERVEGLRFVGVVPGTSVSFRIALANDSLSGAPVSRQTRAYVDVRADGYAVLLSREIVIVVPADDGVSR